MSIKNTRTHLRSALYWLIAIAAVGATLSSLAAAAEPPSLDEIKARWTAQREKLTSLHVEYTLRAESTVAPEVLVSLPPFETKIFLPKEETHFAFKGQKRYHRLIERERPELLPPREAPKVDPKASPSVQKRQRRVIEQVEAVEEIRANPDRLAMPSDVTYAFDGIKAWKRRTIGSGERPSEVFVYRSDSSKNWWQPKEYLACVGLGVPAPLERSKYWQELHRTRLMPDLLDARPYKVLSETEKIDGCECVVLEAEYRRTFEDGEQDSKASRDKIWLDLGHGLAIRQREHSYDGLISGRSVNSELFELLPGFWLSKESQTQSFASAGAPEEYLNKPIEINKMKLTRWVVNEVPDDLFQLVVKPGERVHDLRVTPR